MKVDGSNGMNVTKIYNENMGKSVGEKEKTGKKYDTIEISKEGLEVARLVAIAKELPDVRVPLVNEIKSRIQDGTYKVTSEQLAFKMMEAMKGEV